MILGTARTWAEQARGRTVDPGGHLGVRVVLSMLTARALRAATCRRHRRHYAG